MNVLIIGLGSIAKKHIEALQTIYSDIVFYALRSSNRGQDEKGVHNIFHIRDIVEKPDFIIISNSTELHAKAIFETIKLESPLFIEKPALANLLYAAELSERINKAQILTYVACNMRFHPAIKFLKRFLDETDPIINEVNIYCGSYLPEWRPGRDFREVYSANASMGGGVHLDLIHELDYCKWLFGVPEEVNSVKRNHSSLHIDAMDFAHYGFLYENFSVNITLNYYRRDAKREIEIITDNDTIVVDLVTNSISTRLSGEQLFSETFNMRETYLAQMTYFIDSIKQNQQPMNSFYEGVETLKLAMHG